MVSLPLWNVIARRKTLMTNDSAKSRSKFANISAARLSYALITAFIVFTGIPAVGSIIHSIIYYPAPGSIINNAYAQGPWYLGKGVKQGMYVTYQIQFQDTNQGRPFEMTIYFQNQTSNGDWIAPAFVNDQGKIINGTLKLSSLNLSPLGGPPSNTPPEMGPYINAYRNALVWLEAYASKSDPKSLSSPAWGVIAAIGGQQIGPTGTEKITVPAGTYDTSVISWHKGVDNKIWVNNDFPYPIKAMTFADVTIGNPPIQYAFTLEKTGMGQPSVPKGMSEVPTPPLQQRTARGTYTIQLNWQPVSIEPGKNVTFVVGVADNLGNLINSGIYSLTVNDANGTLIKQFTDQQINGGIGQPLSVIFPKQGIYRFTVTVNSVAGQGTGLFTESANYNIVAVPEFPLTALIALPLSIAMVSLATFAMNRFKGTKSP
jgi:hypothetical protein